MLGQIYKHFSGFRNDSYRWTWPSRKCGCGGFLFWCFVDKMKSHNSVDYSYGTRQNKLYLFLFSVHIQNTVEATNLA